MTAHGLVLLAALCFGTTGTAQALGPADASPIAVGLARIVVGGALLGALAVWSARRASTRVQTGWEISALIAVGAVGVVAYQPAFFAGSRANGVALGAVVALGSAAVFTGALEWARSGRFPGRVWLAATAVALVGVALLSGLLDRAERAVTVVGLLCSMGAGLSYAVYAVTTKRLLERGWGSAASIGGIFGVAAVIGLPLLLANGAVGWVGTASGLALTAWLGVVTTAGAYVLFAHGLSRLSATTVSTLTLAEPMAACALGLWVLGETLSGTSIIGLLVLSAGLILLALDSARPAATQPQPAPQTRHVAMRGAR
jgi:drug/metabolite transporter, DME family